MPCTNGGTCEDRRGDFFCSCPPGLTGKTCGEETDECSTDPCLNGGTCTDLFLDFTCNCSLGYTGRTCDIGEFIFAKGAFFVVEFSYLFQTSMNAKAVLVRIVALAKT